MQESRVQSLIRKDPTCHRATKPMPHSYGVCALEPRGPQLLKPTCPRVCAPQQEKPQQQGAHKLQLETRPHSPQLEKSPRGNEDPAQPKINSLTKLFLKRSDARITLQVFLNPKAKFFSLHPVIHMKLLTSAHHLHGEFCPLLHCVLGLQGP